MSKSRTEDVSSPVSSFTEWDPLEEIVVGSAEGAIYPEYGPILAAIGDPGWLIHYQGAFVEEELVDSAVEQIDSLVGALEGEGVVVRRPDPVPHNAAFSTPWWSSRGGWNAANPRDLFLVVGDEIIECASPQRHRLFEALAYRRVFRDYFRRGARWSSAPMPALREPLYDYGFVEELESRGGHQEASVLPPGVPHRYPITEYEPVFEAADFVRAGRDIFVTRSTVTNALGIEWVRRHLGGEFRVHEVETRCPTPQHIDTTLVLLAPGRALVHPLWVDRLPEALAGWDVLIAPEPEYSEESPMASPYFTSQWLSMNVLSVDERRVFVDDQQVELTRMLERHGFEVLPLAFDAVGAFGGSFHCVTLDVRRRGGLEDYSC